MMNFANMKKSASSIFILSLGVFRGGGILIIDMFSWLHYWVIVTVGFVWEEGLGSTRGPSCILAISHIWDLASQQQNCMHLLTCIKPMAAQFIHLFEFYSHTIVWRSNKNHSMIGKKFCSHDIRIYPPGGKTFSACRMVLGEQYSRGRARLTCFHSDNVKTMTWTHQGGFC